MPQGRPRQAPLRGVRQEAGTRGFPLAAQTARVRQGRNLDSERRILNSFPSYALPGGRVYQSFIFCDAGPEGLLALANPQRWRAAC